MPYRPRRPQPWVIVVIVGVVIAVALATVGMVSYFTTTPTPTFDDSAASSPAPQRLAVPRVDPMFPPGPPEAMTAADALAELRVAGPDLRTPYSSEIREREFGGWLDVDHDGCDTRKEILARQASSGTLDDDGCPATGSVVDPYTGAVLPFAKIQIDHVVALGDVWRTGGQNMTRDQRAAITNDQRNLLAVSGHENGSKSDRDAAHYLPPADQCGYAARQTLVKWIYRRWLWVEPAEHDALARVLRGCAGWHMPTDRPQ